MLLFPTFFFLEFSLFSQCLLAPQSNAYRRVISPFAFHCSLFSYGRSGLRPSLVQGLRPRNAPPQKPSLTDDTHSSQQFRSAKLAAVNQKTYE